MSQWLFTTTRWSIYLRDRLRCVYCDITIVELIKERGDNFMTVDHIRSRSMGGSNDPSNLITSCYSCNDEKNNKSLRAFCSSGVMYNRVRARIRSSRGRDIENYRPAAKILLGRLPGVNDTLMPIVENHDWLVKRRWGDTLDSQWFEHLQDQQSFFCISCTAPIMPHTGLSDHEEEIPF